MTLSKRQKVLSAVGAALLVVGVVDRFFLGADALGPSTAAAADGVDAMNAAPLSLVSPTALVPESRLRTRRSRLAGCLARLAREEDPLAPEDRRDPFCPPPRWLPQDESLQLVQGPGLEKARAFVAAHKLRAVMLDTAGCCAIVDDELLRIGQVLDGFELVSVTKHSAVLTSDGARVTLNLKEVTP